MGAVFRRSWVCVGRDEELQHPGRWIREVVAGEGIVVVRGVDLRLRAFFDVCRHRGASIVGCADSGRSARFECPYHGWTYETDGRLVLAPFTSLEGFDRGAHGLIEARVETWRGFVFVALDQETPPLLEWLGESPPWLDCDRVLRLGRRVRYEVGANWKLLVENFQESHHFPRVHRALEHMTPTGEAHTWMPAARNTSHWLGGTMEIVPPNETVSLDGLRHGRALIFDTKTVHDAMLFPSLLTSLQPDYLLTYRLVPLRVDRTQITADIYFHPASAGEFKDVYDFWDRVNAEDRAICEDQQRNTSSRAFSPACYVSVEEGMHAFDRMVAAIHASHHAARTNE
jgi:glycine betaine catabolism A